MVRTEIDFHPVLFIKPIANTQPSCPLFYLQGHMIMKDITTRTISHVRVHFTRYNHCCTLTPVVCIRATVTASANDFFVGTFSKSALLYVTR